jgi:hypothetical protein
MIGTNDCERALEFYDGLTTIKLPTARVYRSRAAASL